MELIKRTPEQLHDELLPSATERVKRSLALSQLAEDENLDVTAQEIDEEIDKIAGGSGEQGEQMRQIFSSQNGRTVVERNLRTRKTIERLTEIASQDGAAPKKKSTKKKTEAQPGGDETKEES
jgi:trigger factor